MSGKAGGLSMAFTGSSPAQAPASASATGTGSDYDTNPRKRGDHVEVAFSLGSIGASRSLAGSFLSSSLHAGLTFESLKKGRPSQLDPAPHDALLLERSEAGQAARRKALQGKVVAFISAGYSGKRFVYEKASQLGCKVVIVDGLDSWSKQLVDDGVAARFVALDMTETETVLRRVVEELTALEKEGLKVDGVCTFSEVAVPLVARVAEVMGLPGNSHVAVDNARDKHATRRVMAKNNLPTPTNVLFEGEASIDELHAAAEKVGFPGVLKPTGGAASIGVLRVDTVEQLVDGFRRVKEEMERSRIDQSGVLIQLRPGQTAPEGSRPVDSALMLEEYIDGQEIDCDVILDNAVPVYARVTDNWPTHEPWFNETGDNCPSLLSSADQESISKLCTDTLAALGFACGVFHVEGKVSSRGPRIIEVNTRMGGGQVRDNNLFVWGVDLVEEHIITAVGLPSRPVIADPVITNRSTLYINAPCTGIMGPGDWMSEVRTWPGVVYARVYSKEGDKVVCAKDGLPTWIGQVMCDGATIKDAIDLVNKADKSLKPPILASS